MVAFPTAAFHSDSLDTAALSLFLDHITSLLNDTVMIPFDPDMIPEWNGTSTEAETLAKARRGQGRFRLDLLNLWQGRCAVTGVSPPALLHASHLKPWRQNIDRERMDAFNGLLLAVHLDALFDRKLITCTDSGSLIVSKRLPARDREVLGLASHAKSLLLNIRHLEYVTAHPHVPGSRRN